MTPKQQRFVQEYLIDLNGTQAYIRAGYSPGGAAQSAERLLRNAEIQAAVAQGQKRMADTAQFTAEDILRDLEDMRQQALGLGQISAAIRAAELRGKLMGYFVEKRETVLKDERMVVNAPTPEQSAEDWVRKYGSPAH